MVTALKGALSGSLENVILGLMKNTAHYDAFELRASMKVSFSPHIQRMCASSALQSASLTYSKYPSVASTQSNPL